MDQRIVPAGLVGKAFDCDFGGFVPRLTYRSDTELHVRATIGDTQIDEVVAIGSTAITPDLILVSWTEGNGNFVVQLQDHANAVVHNVARLADGQVFQGRGAIQPVPSN